MTGTGHQDRSVRLVVCSPNRWEPKIRREHAMVDLATRDGHAVAFIAAAHDVRLLCRPGGRREWLRGWSSSGSVLFDGLVRVRLTSTIVPAHRGGLAAGTDTWRLRRVLLQEPDIHSSVIVAIAPWQWPAVRSVSARRTIFDCGDDWAILLPRRRKAMLRLYERIGREADAVVVVSRDMARYFPGQKTAVVANGVGPDVLGPPPTPRPTERRMVYVGTVNERFDAPLVAQILRALPGWRLDIFGGCAYAGHRTAPGEELRRLVSEHGDSVRWHGPVGREHLSRILDSGRTLIVPHRAELSAGQDSQKLYEYAARGRPIVSTNWSPWLADLGTPGLAVADDAGTFAASVLGFERDDPQRPAERRQWAQAHRWEHRWNAWSRALFGD
jgi:glycosyltransferase involved in cell wall biosynthesis